MDNNFSHVHIAGIVIVVRAQYYCFLTAIIFVVRVVLLSVDLCVCRSVGTLSFTSPLPPVV